MLRIASIKEIDAAPGAAALPEEQVAAVVAAVLESELAEGLQVAAGAVAAGSGVICGDGAQPECCLAAGGWGRIASGLDAGGGLAVWKRAAAAEACGIRGFRLGL